MSLSLNERQLNEKTFFDKQAHTFNQSIIIENFEKITAVENKEALKEMGGKNNLKDKTILDLGCGIGDAAIYFAMQGAKTYGIDISPKMIDISKKLAKKYHKNHTCSFSIGTAERINFRNNYFDFIFGNGILHHTDIKLTIKEVNRVLKKGGKAIFIEPLSYNPFINIYRTITTKNRSYDEKPLSLKDFRLINRYFNKFKHREFWLLSLYLFLHFYLTGNNPNKIKYWKKIIVDADKYKHIYKPLKLLDDIILKIFPPIRLLCWTTVIKLKK